MPERHGDFIIRSASAKAECGRIKSVHPVPNSIISFNMFCLIVQSYGQHRVIQSYFIFQYLQSNIRRKDVSIPNAGI